MIVALKKQQMFKTIRLVLFVFIATVAVSGLSADSVLANHTNGNGTLKTYTTDLNGAYTFGNDFCSHNGNLVGDYVWLTARDGSNVVKATAGDPTVDVVVHYGGRYCKQWSPTNAYSTYTSTIGSVNGSTPSYGVNNDSNLYFNGSVNDTLDIRGQGAGGFDVCMTLFTITTPGFGFRPSPSACTRLVLELKYPWTTSGESRVGVEISPPNVTYWPFTQPNQTVTWNHRLWNSSSYDMNRTIYWSVRQDGFTAANAVWRNSSADPQGWNKGGAGGSYDRPFVNEGPSSPSTQYSVQQEDVGRTLCQWLVWTPPRDVPIDSEVGQSNKACVYVPYNFNLSPSVEPIEGSADLVVEPGATISTVRPKVNNSGPTKSYDNTAWQLSRIVVNPGVTPPAGTDNSTAPCGYYNAGGSVCANEASAADRTFGTGDTIVNQLNDIAVGDMAAGQKLCFALSVQKYDAAHQNNNGQWRHSTPMCVTIGKKPKVQVWGGDLSVGRRFAGDTTSPNDSSVNVSTSSKDNRTKTFGSWVEYGVFAPRTITGGSSAGLAGSNGNASATQSDWSKLTFANSGHTPVTGCDGMVKFGCYAQASSMGVIPSVAARLAPAAANSVPQLNGTVDLNGRNGTYYSSGNLTITASTIAKGNSVIIKAAGTVIVDGNISYTTDSLSSISDIPQVVIIANNIQIKDTVTNVDAWLIANGASGRIYSCNNYDFSQILTDKTCKEKLMINGPVMAKKLYLTRTAGSGVGPASGDPGEVLNLRADAYLWAINRSQGAGRIQTTETRELAPRF